jgi:hypothetical protein
MTEVIIIIANLSTVIILLVYLEAVRQSKRIKAPLKSVHLVDRLRKERINPTLLAKNFYRIYKYLYVQTASGARPEDILKSMHQIVDHSTMKKVLIAMSAILAQTNDIEEALNYLKIKFDHEEGEILVGILKSITVSGLSQESFLRLDHMLFQKYLAQLRRDTTQIKRTYFYAIVCFTIAASMIIFIPLLEQMLNSANIIFS